MPAAARSTTAPAGLLPHQAGGDDPARRPLGHGLPLQQLRRGASVVLVPLPTRHFSPLLELLVLPACTAASRGACWGHALGRDVQPVPHAVQPPACLHVVHGWAGVAGGGWPGERRLWLQKLAGSGADGKEQWCCEAGRCKAAHPATAAPLAYLSVLPVPLHCSLMVREACQTALRCSLRHKYGSLQLQFRWGGCLLLDLCQQDSACRALHRT